MRVIRQIALLLTLVVPALARAQVPAPAAEKKILGVDDYTRWRSLDAALISSDGRWVAYGVRFANTLAPDAKPVLRLRNTATDVEVEIVDASQASFSSDAKWITYLVETPARRPAARADSAAAPATAARGTAGQITRRWELRELATGRVQLWQEMQSAVFSPDGRYLVLRRRAAGTAGTAGAATGAGGGGGGGAGASAVAGGAGATAPRGLDAVVHNLTTGRSLFLGSVAEIAFNAAGDRLAYLVDATVRDVNGLYVMTLASGRIEALDVDTLRYSRLTWNDRGTGLATLKGREVDKKRERSNHLVVVADIAAGSAPVVLNPATATGFPAGFVLTERAALLWSDDATRVFVAMMPQTAAADTGRRRSTDSLADVDVWRSQDDRVQSEQMIQVEADRNRTYRQAFVVAESRFVVLSDSSMRELELPLAGEWAVGRDERAYVSDYRRPAADFYRVNTRTGARTLLLTGQLTGQHVGGISSAGRYFLYWKDARWNAYDLVAGTTRTIGAGAPSLVDREYDYPGPRPPYGIAGYAADGSGVLATSRFDLWFLPFTENGVARDLTNGVGSRDKIVLRPIRIAPIDSTVLRAARVSREFDLAKPITFSAYGEYTKKAGFYRLADGQLRPLLFEDAAFTTPSRARDVDLVLFTRQTFSVFPDLQLANGAFAEARKLSDLNPQQAEYRWGHRVLFDYTTRRGVKLQGILALPDDYLAGEKLPMLVTFYEKNSQTMHRYPMPSFLTGMGGMPVEAVSRGYATMLPDVFFHTGLSHTDMLDAVEAATRKVIAMGYVDPARIGVHGHSYGGEGAAFIGTRSSLFAAVGMGAGVTDLTSDFSQSWGWSYQVSGGSGQNGNDYYLFGQGRWGFSPWEQPERYRFESALTHAPEAKAPFLIMHGTADPTVSFSEGMNFYNALRYNGKSAVMLAYPGEGHGLRGLANRKDLTIRYFQYFDHYLRGTAAPAWMTTGVPFIAKELLREPK